MDKSLYLAYAADDNYSKYLGISMLSLFQTNRDFENINVFILDCGIEEENKEKINSISKEFKRNVHFIDMESAISRLDLNMGPRKISIASYARLFLSSVIPDECNKILYLDCDTIVCGNLEGFWNTQIDDYMVAGVRDTVDKYFLKKIGLNADDYYVNAGIILINLEAWRRNNIQQRFIKFIEKFDGNVPHHDQGTINAVCNKKILFMPPAYNVTSNIYTFSKKTIEGMYKMQGFYLQEELDEAKKNPVIIHYTTGIVGRPWEKNCTHPMKEEYTKVAELSHWKDEPILADNRSISVKMFASLYKYSPNCLSVAVYRLSNWILH